MSDTPARRPIHRGRVVDLGLEAVPLPDGRVIELEVVRHPGGAAVVALDAAHRVCLIRQWRHAAGGWVWEIPAGKLDPGEAPLVTAQRELAEEAGVHATEWASLGDMLSTPGFCDEVIHLYAARGLTLGAPATEAHELIEVHWFPIATAQAMARDGTIRDAKTVIALLRLPAR